MISKQIDDLRAYAKDRKGELAKLVSDAADTIEMLSAQAERTCVNCGRTANNGGWYADGRTLCIAERWVLPFVGEKERYG